MARKFAVIGLGRFGAHLARRLAEQGAEVLAIDVDMARIDAVKDHVTHAVRLDATDGKALATQNLQEFDAVVVAIGEGIEANLLAVAALQEIGVQRIIVRANFETHARILQHMGIDEIVLPHQDTAERLARSLMVTGVIDTFQLSEDYEILEVAAPERFVGKTLAELNLRQRFGVNVITIKRFRMQPQLLGLRRRQVTEILGTPLPDTVITAGDRLIVFGRRQDIQRMLQS